MKQIQSAGGPLIGLDRDHLDLWSGVFGKKFVDRSTKFKNDYEAAGYLTDGRTFPPCTVARIDGDSASGVLIAEPDSTALLQIDADAVYIAQIECCEPGWDFSLINKEDFQKAIFRSENSVTFFCQSCQYVIFDSAYKGENCGDDCLIFNLDRGKHVLSYAYYVKDEVTELILYKICKNLSV